MFKFLVFLSLITFNFFVVGQKNMEYSGSYKMFNTIGYSKYNFIVNQFDTVKNKEFYFEKNDELNDSSKTVSQIVFKGQYINGLKTKSWSLDYFSLSQNGKPFINSNGFIAYSSNGFDYKLRAEFNNDQAVGNWTVWSTKINKSIATDTIFSIDAKIKSGNLNGVFYAKDTLNQLILNTNDLGMLNGEFWLKDTQNKTKEFRLYEDGWLKEHWLEQNQKKYTVSTPVITDSIKYEIISFDSIYLNYLYYFQMFNKIKSDMGYVINQNNNTTLWYLNSLNYFKGYNLWNENKKEIKVQSPKIKLQLHELTKDEDFYLKNIVQNYEISKSILNNFLKDPNLDFYEHVSHEIARVKVVLIEYQKIHQNIFPLYQFINSPVIKFFNRSTSLKSILLNYNFNNTFKYEFNDSITNFEYDFKKLQNLYAPNLNSLNNLLKSIKDSVFDIQNYIQPLLKKLEGETKLSSKEKELLHLNDSILWLFSNENNLKTYNSYHQIFQDNIQLFTKSIVKKYANLTVDQKIANLDNYLNCMYDILNFQEIVSKIPSKLERIDELYKRVVFNPYTFTDMEERVKERLYIYFEQVILPKVIMDINNNMNCDNFYEKVENIDRLYRQMVVLRDRDTKDLERLIKKNENQKEILEMFNIKIDMN